MSVKQCYLMPTAAALMANASPAGPAPTTARFFSARREGLAFWFRGRREDSQARGDFANEDLIETGLIAANQVLISSARPDCAFDSSSASAETVAPSIPYRHRRAREYRRHLRIVNPVGGYQRQRDVAFQLRVTQLNAPRGTGVAMVGIRLHASQCRC